MSTTNSHLATPRMENMPRGTALPISGLKWHNDDFDDSCNIDSFLSFIKIISLKHPTFLLANLKLKHDKSEKVIQDIILSYQSSKQDAMLLELQDNLARISWATTVLLKPMVPGEKVNLRGSEEEHVFNYLNASSLIHWEYSCTCGPQYLTVNSLEVNTGTQLVEFHRTNDPTCGPYHHKRCMRCHQHFVFKKVTMPEATWLIRVVFDKVKGTGAHPEKLPKFLSFDNFVFKLGYISYYNVEGKSMLHQTSCHLVQDQWFHYDGVKYGGELRKVTENLIPARHTPLQAVYYKIFESPVPKIENLKI